MRRYLRPLLFTLLILALGFSLWPLITANIGEVKAALIVLKKYCLANPWTGYFLYSAILSTILFAGLPIATIAMLLAGVIYGFWEAATLVTLCRLLTAVAAFVIARYLVDAPNRPSRKAPYIIRKFERHPNLGLFLARLAPIPDSVVNYTIAASPITNRDYVVLSLLGMIPFTLLCVWLGSELGTVSHLIRWMQ